MNKSTDPIQFLSRADRLAIIFDTERALADWKKTPKPEMEMSIRQIFEDQASFIVAEALVQQLATIKVMLLNKVGNAFGKELCTRVNTPKVSNGWELKRNESEGWSKKYAGQRLIPKSELTKQEIPFLHVEISQAYNKIYLGITRNYEKNKHPEWESQEIQEFEALLRHQRGYRRGGQWWLGYEHLYFLNEEKFFLEAAGNMSILVTEIADKYMNLFNDYRERLEKTNQTLLQLVS